MIPEPHYLLPSPLFTTLPLSHFTIFLQQVSKAPLKLDVYPPQTLSSLSTTSLHTHSFEGKVNIPCLPSWQVLIHSGHQPN